MNTKLVYHLGKVWSFFISKIVSGLFVRPRMLDCGYGTPDIFDNFEAVAHAL